eukprot:Colp12_sorted_trinity150504_noHs@18896
MKAALVGVLFLLAVATGDPTEGWTEQPLLYTIQKPYDVPLEQRYTFHDGIHEFKVLSTDKPYSASSPTEPRTEMRMKNDYTGGNHQFSGEVFVEGNTTGVSIMQIFGGSPGVAATSFQLRVFDNSLTAYNAVIMKNVANRWIKLNVQHFTGSGKINVFLNGELVHTRQDNGHDDHYFKIGVYASHNPSHLMAVRYRNIHIYSK